MRWVLAATAPPPAMLGLGRDRTSTSNNVVSQYHPSLREQLASLSECPDKYLLWFHHVPWDHEMRSGQTLWNELCLRYQGGVNWTRKARHDWEELSGAIYPQRHAAIATKLAIQERDATVWHDACLLYFQIFSKRPFPNGVETPRQTLEEIKASMK